MPAEDWPSFHCRPSTARTFLPFSVSTRHTPTTLNNDFDSAPAASAEKSILIGCGAAAARPSAPSVNAQAANVPSLSVMRMAFLHGCDVYLKRGRTPAPPPGTGNQQRQNCEEPNGRNGIGCDERITWITVRRSGRRHGHTRELVKQGQDFARAAGTAGGQTLAVGIGHLAVGFLALTRDQ